MPYEVTATSADGGGSFTFPVGTIFPPRLAVTYNEETGRREKLMRVIRLEGIFQGGTREQNFDRYFELDEYVAGAGRVALEIAFNGATEREFEVTERGPRLNNCQLVQRGGSLSTHAHFQVDVEIPEDVEDDDLSRTTRQKTQERYDGRLIATQWSVTVTGKKAKDRVYKFKPKDDAGPLEEVAVQQVDARTWQATWRIATPHKVGEYVLWRREIAVVEGGSPLDETRILGSPWNADFKGPILRRMPRAAWQVQDTNRFITLKRWLKKVPKLKPLFSKSFRDPTRSNAVSPWLPSDEVRGMLQREFKDFFLVNDDGLVQKAIEAVKVPDVAQIKEPKDPKNWEKLRA